MYLKVTYDQDFYDLFMWLKSKHPKKLFDIDGIGRQTDMSEFSKNFFSNKSNISDISIDVNANVDDMSVIAYDKELPKPFFRLNSYYVLWKKMRQLYGKEKANDIIEKQLTGDIYINDFHGIGAGKPYSYDGKTNLILKIDGNVIMTTMDDLFDMFREYKTLLSDREEIDLTGFDVKILDESGYVDLKYVLRHNPHNSLVKLETKNGCTTIVTEDHPVILEDGTEKNACDLTLSDKLKGHEPASYDGITLTDSTEEDINRAYFIGFLIGDGFIHHTFKKDGTQLVYDDIKSSWFSIRQNNIIETKIYDIANSLYDNVCLKGGDIINIHNKVDCLGLSDIGFGANNKKLPVDVLNWSKQEQKSLFSGLIDSDGTVNKKSGIVDVRVCSFALVQQIKEIAKIVGCDRIRTSFVGDYHSENSYKSNYDMYRVSFVLTDIDFINLSEKVKYNKDIVFKERGIDGRWEGTKLHKIETVGAPEWVYDVTTETGTFYSQGLIQHNCFNYSTYDIMLFGLPMVQKIKSSPPKYLYSFKSQLEQFVTVASNSTLGATGLADMLLMFSMYTQRILHTNNDVHFCFASEDDIWRYVEANIESFIYTINQPMRGNQSPFTNISVYDRNFLESLCSDYTWTYEWEGEEYQIQPEIKIVQKLQVMFLDVMNRELSRTPVTFPVTTACFSIDSTNEIQDEEFLNMIAEKNKEFGFINIYSGKTSTLSSCCRLRSDKENEYFNSFGSGSSKIGSLGVSTINFPRLAWKSQNEEEFLSELVKLVIDCQDVNNAKRHIVQKRIDNGNHPLYTLGYMELTKQYSTVGVNGLYEAVEIMGYDILTKEGQDFTIRVLDTINDTNNAIQKKYNAPHNVEQIPAENVAVKLAEKDKLLKYNNGEYDLYSNQFIPLVNQADLLDRIELQGLFDSHFSGGAIAHLNIEQRIEDTTVIANLIRAAASKGVVYFAINFILVECEEGHMSVGHNLTACPICGGEIVGEYTRVVGFLTPIRTWHKVRREVDFPNRKFEHTSSLVA